MRIRRLGKGAGNPFVPVYTLLVLTFRILMKWTGISFARCPFAETLRNEDYPHEPPITAVQLILGRII